MLAYIRRYQKGISIFLLLNFVNTIGIPTESYALTSGPSQPETQQFAPAGMDNMVDPFTGDFSYNIPLMDVGGYPININYSAGITPDQEASWVGLGWNLNVGAINRSVRGIPDDFAGDEITTEHTVKPNQTFGLTFAPPTSSNLEFFTFKIGLSQNYNIFYNNYNGYGFSFGFTPSLDIPMLKKFGDNKFKLGLNVNLGSESGLGITPSFGVQTSREKNRNEGTLNASIGFPFSTREGAKGMSMSASFNYTSTPDQFDKYREPESTDPENTNGFGAGGSSFKGFATPTYTTFIQHDAYSVNATLNVAPEALNLVKADKTRFILGGYYNGQFAKTSEDKNPAYGFLYEGISSDPKSILDFNREKDAGYNGNTTNMPVTNHTYDVYSVQGEGVGGAYRIFRSDVGTVGDNLHTDETISPDLGLSGGFKMPDMIGWKHVKIGIDFKYIHSESSAGRWSDGRIQHQDYPYDVANNIQEKTYFGKIGDNTPENLPDYVRETLLGDALYEYYLSDGFATGDYEKKDGTRGAFNKNGSSNYLRGKRKNRTNSFSYLTAAKADKFAVAPILNHRKFSLEEYPDEAARRDAPVKYDHDPLPISRVGGVRKGHHISEIKVTNNSGSRYVYGIPVYNNEQHEVTFSVDAEGYSQSITNVRSSGLVKYDRENDPTLGNSKGLEHYYQRTHTPGNASAYLLTYILSSDYVDSDGVPGPSDGDLGTYVKFNYSRTSVGYKWRTPFQEDMANFADGLAGKRNDDKGSYTYGTKEVWYLHSIETRTHLAEFHLEDREDGIGVKSEHGGLEASAMDGISDENKLKCIRKIVLYAKADKLNGKNEPLKTVHFQYDYSLCPLTPNSVAKPIPGVNELGKGKLTLKKVWFTYGFSNKGILNPYTFDYADRDFDGDLEVNYPYNSKDYDRWGIYKKQAQNIGNEAFPYTVQDKSETDPYAAAYSLTRIFTPTGGEMRIHYESDDYGFVQNQTAMRMFRIKGVSGSNSSGASSQIYSSGPTNSLTEKMYLHIDLNEGFTSAVAPDPVSYFRNNYLGGMSELQYKVKMKVLSGSEASETILGYCSFDVNDVHVISESDGNGGTVYKTAVVRLIPEALNRGTNDIHPFTKNGWLYAKMHYNRELMGSVDAEADGFLQVVGSILSATNSVLQLFFGFRLYMKDAGHSNEFIPAESFVRLYEHDKIKLGGGHRVKAIVMMDRWDIMKSDRETGGSGIVKKEVAAYGQVYDYTMPEDITDPESRIISSGVAAYEPIIGGEENPIRRLVKTTDRVPLAPDKEYYSETPYGESYFPAPVVGYRKVRTIPAKIQPDINGFYEVEELTGNGTGYVEQEFYTAYDFPTWVSQTDLRPYRENTSQLNPLKIRSSDFVSCSQGYLIELNDMHGKPKSTKVMPDVASGSSNPISYVMYLYKVKAGDPSRLDNKVPLVDHTLSLVPNENREIATTVDVVNDTRYYKSLTSGGGADVNVKLSFPPPFPVPPAFLPVISAFPDVNFERTMFNSITTTKVVNRYGVLVKTIAQDNGQTITTENLAWDAETGDVLLTKVQNEYHDPIFSFTYPGYWAYEAMGMSYQNEGFQFTNLDAATINNLKDGDEVICTYKQENVNKDTYAYYHKLQNKLLKKDGSEIPPADLVWAQVVRSGARNVPTTPVASVSMLKNPLTGNEISFENVKILNAGAAEFKHIWKGFCNCGEQSKTPANPFITGQRGQLRPWRSWTYLTERTQTKTSGELNTRADGFFSDYNTFWKKGGAYLIPYYLVNGTSDHKWQSVIQIENYNPLGMEIENKDTLGRFSMAQFGYGRSLPVATSNNSRYQETGFDGFEDYDYGDCNDDHFSWRVRQNDDDHGLVNTESHTGKKSFKVPAGSKSRIVKIINPCGISQE